MQRILISWLTPQADFSIEANKRVVNKQGSNYIFHKYFFDYDCHILLSSAKQDNTSLDFMLNTLEKDFPTHHIKTRYIDLQDLIDTNEILSKVQPILLEHKDDQIDLFFSPGTAAMRLAWFILHQNLGLDTRLIQTRPPKNGQAGKPEKLFIQIEKDQLPRSVIIRQQEQHQSKKSIDDYCYTKSIIPIYQQAKRVATADRGNILILGASGTGKEHLAKYIHEHSARKDMPFVVVNCSAFGDNLLESRLFGYKKGSFTGATTNHKGFFEQANGGTIFLDEIGDISPYMQQSLLRVLQNQEITPIGGQPKQINVRIITATNKDLLAECKKEAFRWDLYYRIAVMDLELPKLINRSLQERKKLIKFFIQQKAELLTKTPLILSKAVEQLLMDYTFPGNIRELENLIERIYLLADDIVELEHLPTRLQSPTMKEAIKLVDVEQEHILKIYKQTNYNKTQTAQKLGISLNKLKRRLETLS